MHLMEKVFQGLRVERGGIYYHAWPGANPAPGGGGSSLPAGDQPRMPLPPFKRLARKSLSLCGIRLPFCPVMPAMVIYRSV